MAKHGDSKQVAASARKAKERNLRLIKAFTFTIIVVAALCAGFFIRGDVRLLSLLGFESLAGVDASSTAGGEPEKRLQLAVDARG